jgi:hypothetical protein
VTTAAPHDLAALRAAAKAQRLEITIRERPGFRARWCIAYSPEPPFDVDSYFLAELCAVTMEDAERAVLEALEKRARR